MKKLLAILIILAFSVAITFFVSYIQSNSELKRQIVENEKMHEIAEVIAVGGFPFPVVCQGLCPSFSLSGFLFDTIITFLTILVLIFMFKLLFKKKYKLSNSKI